MIWSERGLAYTTIRWVARLLSIASIAVLVLFFVGEGVAPTGVAPKGEEWIGLLFFPLGVMVGLIVAWWHEGIGGAIVVGGLLAFLGVYGLLLTGGVPQPLPFLAFASPGFLFLLCWLLSRFAPGDAGQG